MIAVSFFIRIGNEYLLNFNLDNFATTCSRNRAFEFFTYNDARKAIEFLYDWFGLNWPFAVIEEND